MRLFAILACALLSCQSRPKDITLYCDPYFEEAARSIVSEWNRQKGKKPKVQLSVKASDLGAQEIRLGAPVDIYISSGDLLNAFGIREMISRTVNLCSDQLVLAGISTADESSIFSDSCLLIASSGTPLRSYTEKWLLLNGRNRKESCMVYGNTAALLRDYLLRGIVKQGITFRSEALRHREKIRIIAEGPLVRNNLQAHLTRSGAASQETMEFFHYLESEASQSKLVDEHFIR